MRQLFAFGVAVIMVVSLGSLIAKEGTEKLVYKSKMGDVTFDHWKHQEREAKTGDCKTCHPKLFPEKKTDNLNYKAGMHRPAETKQISCGFCHRAGGKSFESKGNCNKCHVKGKA